MSASPPPIVVAPILVVDESNVSRLEIGHALHPLDPLLLDARSSEEALRLVERDKLALVILAARLPDDDGMVTLQRLRQRESTRRLPVIMVGAAGESPLGERAYALGASDFLVRPVDAPALRAHVAVLLELFRCRITTAAAEASNREKDELLAVVSHELRTPLNAILGWAEVLLHGKVPADRLHHGLDTIARNARMQAGLVEDLLDLSRIVAGKLTLTRAPIDLALIAERAAETVAPMAAAKNVGLEVVIEPGDHMVIGDGSRLQQVIWNVLSNAVKFSPARTHVELTLHGGDGVMRLMVRDNGSGIAPDLLPHVFERYRQGDSEGARRHGGLGLGLAIARRIVEMHGGTIDAASDGLGRGAQFTVTIPARPRLEIAPRSPDTDGSGPRATAPLRQLSTPPSRLDGLRVLFVDDEADARELLTVVLSDAGAEVRTASCVAEALQLVGSERFDVMVSDIGMPGEDGYSLMRKVSSRVPGIALSAFSTALDRERARDAGFVTHLAKPLDTGALIAFVHHVARR